MEPNLIIAPDQESEISVHLEKVGGVLGKIVVKSIASKR